MTNTTDRTASTRTLLESDERYETYDDSEWNDGIPVLGPYPGDQAIGLREEAIFEDDHVAEILAELGYPEKFECWTDVLGWLSAGSLGKQDQGLKGFMESTAFTATAVSLEPVDEFLRAPVESWANYDDDISTRWDQLVKKVGHISEGRVDVRHLTKPSGPLGATLAFVWHYPTFRSNRVIRGSTFDPSNPSMRWLANKIGFDSSIRVQNRIFLRHKFEREVLWHNEIPGWAQIDQEFLAFNQWLNVFPKVIVLVGENNCRPSSICEMVPLQQDEEFDKIPLRVNCLMYGEIPYCVTVQNSKTKEIRQLILRSYHSQSWLGNHLRIIPALHDCLYNAACEMAQIWVKDTILFSRDSFRVSAAESKRGNTRRFIPAIIVAHERQTGLKMSENFIKLNFSRFISQNPTFFTNGIPQKNESFAEGLLDILRMKSHAKQAEEGYPNLKRGSEIHAALGYPNLSQGRATQANKGYPNLESGHKTQADNAASIRNAKVAAMLRLRQVKRLLQNYHTSLPLSKKEANFCAIIVNFDTDNKKHRGWLHKIAKRKCIFWQPRFPRGLRYENDGCLEPDTFDYDQFDHPALKITGSSFPPDDMEDLRRPLSPV